MEIKKKISLIVLIIVLIGSCVFVYHWHHRVTFVKSGDTIDIVSHLDKYEHISGLFEYGGNEYLGDGHGHVETGWQIVDDKFACYFDESTGKMQKNKMVGYIEMPEDGKLGLAYVEGIRFLDECGWDLEKSFYGVVNKTVYGYKEMRKDTAEEYARQGFEEKQGNCYVSAAQFFICAKLLGYNVTQWNGYVFIKDRPHSWCSIEYKDRVLLYDPTFERSKNENSPSSFGLVEGTPDTWKYLDDRVAVKSDVTK